MIQEDLQKKLNNQYNEELTTQIFEGYKYSRVVSLRINTLKTTKEQILKVLNDNNISFTRISGVTKKNSYVTIGVIQKTKTIEPTDKYTWLSVLEIEDTTSTITIDITKE
jgi:16S rRNA C967 or C1407 C5-methylase (RsmB/RsmF family)